MISNICLSCGDDLDWPSGDGCANMTAHKNDNKPWENLVTDELVKRLRDWPRQGATKSTNLLGDAADRIEALTAERDDALECNEQFFVYNQFLKKRVEKVEAESDRLREALEYILAECTLSDNTMPSVGAIKYAARAALKGEPLDRH